MLSMNFRGHGGSGHGKLDALVGGGAAIFIGKFLGSLTGDSGTGERLWDSGGESSGSREQVMAWV